jgi:hypothetical protein
MMKKLLAMLVVMAIFLAAVVPVLAQTDTASACIVDGRTPGYWKNHIEAWSRYTPDQNFDSVFGVTGHGDLTLIQALGTGGGKFDALNRHAVAALLNSVMFYPNWHSQWFVKNQVQYAYSSGDWQSVKDLFEAANQMGG